MRHTSVVPERPHQIVRRKPLRVALVGCTGSIGTQTLDVCRRHPDRVRLVAVTAHTRCAELVAAAREFGCTHVAVTDAAHVADPILQELPAGCTLIDGHDALTRIVELPEVDCVVSAVVGAAGIECGLAAVEAGKVLAYANKESIVVGGDLIMPKLGEGQLIPVDSEHSAIFQSLVGERTGDLARIWLTCSGGPFFGRTRAELAHVTAEEALAHPTWNMGAKITVDSATLMNKGLEVMEAARLFDFPGERIDVLIHPQSVVHSMVAYRDGTVMANLSNADMRLPIQYAMTWPERIPSPARPLNLWEQPDLSFFKPDMERFPALQMAYDCLKAGGGCPVVYNGANERAAELFFAGRLGFLDIEDSVAYALDRFQNRPMGDLDDILLADGEARRLVDEFQTTRSKA